MNVQWDAVVDGAPFTRCEGFAATTRPDPCVDGAAWGMHIDETRRRGSARLSTPFLFEVYVYELDFDGDRARLCRILQPTDLRSDECMETDWQCATSGDVHVGATLVSVHGDFAHGETIDFVAER